MRKATEIKERIKQIENLLFGEEGKLEHLPQDDDTLRWLRHSLLWVLQSQPKKKKDTKDNKKMEDYDIKKPL